MREYMMAPAGLDNKQVILSKEPNSYELDNEGIVCDDVQTARTVIEGLELVQRERDQEARSW